MKKILSHECLSYDGGDQGYLNHYFQLSRIEVGYLPNGYNYCLDPNMPQLPEYAQYLIHFCGKDTKPWQPGALTRDSRRPYIERWLKEEGDLPKWTL